jgi:hypothetical protein
MIAIVGAVEDDATELVSLAQIQAKRDAESRVSFQNWWGLKQLMTGTPVPTPTPMTSANGTLAAPTPATSQPDTSSFGSGPGALVNRSPVTNYHYYPQTTQAAPIPAPTPTPAPTPVAPRGTSAWPWLLAIPLALGAAGLTYILTRPTTPVTPPPAWTGQTTIKLGDAP